MPFYKVPGLGVVHMKMSGRHKPPEPCRATEGLPHEDGEPRYCYARSAFLCDWPTGPRKTCSAPLCDAHVHVVGPNRHYCPDHFAQHTHENPQRGLFEGIPGVKP